MTKEQAEAKLAALSLLGSLSGSVVVTNESDPETGAPYLNFAFPVPPPGMGSVNISVPAVPSTQNLADIVNTLPIVTDQKAASLAVMLAPSQAGDEVVLGP
jgi:hypothetical protein